MAHPPPIPPEQLSDKVPDGAAAAPDRPPEVKIDPAGGTAGLNLAEQGSTGNTIQNLTNQGHQQDR